MSYIAFNLALGGREFVPAFHARNAHGYGPRIWDVLCTKHGLGYSMSDSAHSQMVGAVRGDGCWPTCERVAYAMTYSNFVLEPSCFGEVADLLEEFDKSLPWPNKVNHLPDLIKFLRDPVGSGVVSQEVWEKAKALTYGDSLNENWWHAYDEEAEDTVWVELENHPKGVFSIAKLLEGLRTPQAG